jgi:DNA polymerase III subunit delta
MPTPKFPIYLFLGDEDFLKEEAVEKLKSELIAAGTLDLNYSVFYGNEKSFNAAEMLGILNTQPFLSDNRLVILKGADLLNASAKKSVLLYAANPKESSIFVIESVLPVIKGEFLLEISKRARLVYYRKLTDSEIGPWLIKKAGSREKNISGEAIETIKRNLSNGVGDLSYNMDNIILYAGKRDSITKEDVLKVTGVNTSHTAFDLINGIRGKNVKKSLEIFSSLRKDRKRETELLGLLGWNARMILRVKELLKATARVEIIKTLGLNPRAFDQIEKHALGLKKTEILSFLEEIFKADSDIKTGSSPTAVIEKLIVKMCS